MSVPSEVRRKHSVVMRVLSTYAVQTPGPEVKTDNVLDFN